MLTVGVVVPNFNGARYLRAAIDSVLQETRASVRCIVMDGGSKDDSLAILREYGSRIEVVSERDEGQADAIGKGFARLDTDLVGWLNSDDRLLPGAIDRTVAAAEREPQGVLFYGDAEIIDEDGRLLGFMNAIPLDHHRLRTSRGKIIQPGSFYRRSAIERCGGVRKQFYLLMDADLWIRLSACGDCRRVGGRLAQFRIHEAAKSSERPFRYYRESLLIAREHDRTLSGLSRRALNIARHFVQWKLGLRVNDRTGLPAPAHPPRVWVDGPAVAAVDKLLAGGALRRATAPNESDLRVSRWPQSPNVGSKSRLGRSLVATRYEIPTVQLLPPTVHAQAICLADVAAPSFFVCVDDAQLARLEALGVPAFRRGTASDPDVWGRAISVVMGRVPEFDPSRADERVGGAATPGAPS